MLEVAPQFREAIGVDRSEAMIQGFKSRLHDYPNVKVEVCDFIEGKNQEKFDYITIG